MISPGGFRLMQRAARRPLWLLLALAMLTSLVPAPPAQAQLAGDPRLGAVQAINAPDAAAKAGVRWERIIFPWSEMQPSGPDQMLQGYYPESQIDAQVKRGVQLVGVVLYTPGWAARDPDRGGASVPKNLDRPYNDQSNYWGRFFSRLADKYKGRIDTWIVWNEPDVFDLDTGISYTWAGNEAEYYQLLKVAYQAAKRANPKASVLTAGMAYWHDHHANRPPYLERMLDVAAADRSAKDNNWYFDGVPVHAYASSLNAYAITNIYRQMLAKRGLKKPVWVAEANAVPWDDPGAPLPREPWRVTMSQQADYILQALALGLAGGADRIGVYKMRDEAPENGQYFGLVRDDGSTRPAYTALQVAISNFAGATSAVYSWNGSSYPPSDAEVQAVLSSNASRYQFTWPGQINQVVLERPGQRVTVVWNVTPRPLTARIAAAASSATVLDSVGRKRTVAAADGVYDLYLAASRTFTEPRDPTLNLVGGPTLIVVEQLERNPAPARPPQALPGDYFSESGYSIARDAFAEYFNARGGLRTFGLPISREFDLLGAPAQLFQRQLVRLAPDGGVELMNLVDQGLLPYTKINGSVLPGVDPSVSAGGPAPGDPAYGQKIVQFVRDRAPDTWQGRPVNFGSTVFNSVRCEEAFANEPCRQDLLPLIDFEIWGAPLSAPTPDPGNGGFVYQRFQRGILHYDDACKCTQGLLLGTYLRALITGQGLPGDLEEQAKDSPYLRQYDNARVQGMTRPGALPRTSFKDAFDPEPR
jgi:hypothetical protein